MCPACLTTLAFLASGATRRGYDRFRRNFSKNRWEELSRQPTQRVTHMESKQKKTDHESSENRIAELNGSRRTSSF